MTQSITITITIPDNLNNPSINQENLLPQKLCICQQPFYPTSTNNTRCNLCQTNQSRVAKYKKILGGLK